MTLVFQLRGDSKIDIPAFLGGRSCQDRAPASTSALGEPACLCPCFLLLRKLTTSLPSSFGRSTLGLGKGGVGWQRKEHRWSSIIPNPQAWPWEALGCGARGGGQPAGSSAPGGQSLRVGLGAHLAWDSAVVCAALPETPAVACDASDELVLIGEVHLPDQGPVTKNPHFPLAPRRPPWRQSGSGLRLAGRVTGCARRRRR